MQATTLSYAWMVLAAICEIAGCFSFWVWLRQGRSAAWLIPGMLALAVFALALTRIDSALAGRAYAAYGGVYIAAALLWLWLVEKHPPDHWDWIGVGVCLAGSMIILFGPRT